MSEPSKHGRTLTHEAVASRPGDINTPIGQRSNNGMQAGHPGEQP